MRLATFYHNNPPIPLENIDEYNITFYPDKSNYDILQQRMIEWDKNGKRINLYWKNEKVDIDKINTLFHLNNNLSVRIDKLQLKYISELIEKKIPFFLDSSLMIYSYSLLDWAIRIKPTDIYIGDDLCYNLREVSTICKKNNIRIRMILNRLPTVSSLTAASITAPIFRPQDYDLLNLYINTAEFDCSPNNQILDEKNYNWEAFEVYYRRWFVEHYWPADMNNLNKDLVYIFPNKETPTEFSEYRINCNHRCTMNSYSNCNKCLKYTLIGEQLRKLEYVKRNRNNEN